MRLQVMYGVFVYLQKVQGKCQNRDYFFTSPGVVLDQEDEEAKEEILENKKEAISFRQQINITTRDKYETTSK
jgi:hypothetical protein